MDYKITDDEASPLGFVARNTYNAQRNHSSSKPGQQNPGLVRINPNSDMPPATDHGVLKPSWYSFDLTHRRVQEGGWTHQVTERELPTSTDIAGVDMRLTSGTFRELHWHLADEWAIMLKGKARVTVFTAECQTASKLDPHRRRKLTPFPVARSGSQARS